ncbi:hypothetical protein AAGG74_15430 [Bacillus mexicanus]|uniref:hypothetical protein n=1 Tax=Bacillus mexicanus TaxID=2834415 RepID=UPI003D2265D5
MDDIISKAEEKVERIKQDPELIKMYDARFKQITDEANRIKAAEDQKEYSERKTTVSKLMDQGWSLEKIEEVFGYDPKKYL